MKAFVYAMCATTMAALLTFPAFAQESSSANALGVVQNGNRTIIFERSRLDVNYVDQLSAFGQLAANDPSLASKLASRPSLVNDQGFVDRHAALQQFFEKFPDAREDIVANPGNYLTPVSGSSWSRAPARMEN
jgi:hypothetical protein